MSQPNIVYIHSHDTGRYIQPYGHAVETPRLQQLADEGVLFRNCCSAAPTCSPSRAALLTGQSPHQSGMLGLAHRGFALYDPRQHLAHTLRNAGYATVLAGFQHLAPKPQTAGPEILGYDTILPADSILAADVGAAVADYLGDAPQTPFFIDAGFFETHREFPEVQSPGEHILPPGPLPDAQATRQDMATYHAAAKLLDAGVGKILDALAQNGLLENTLVIYTTDHGLAFPRMKCNLTDHGIGVALILRGPSRFADAFTPASVCDALISQIDIFPTLCDLLEIEPPAWLTGKSFLPILQGRADEINEAIFAEVTYHAAYEPQRCVRTRRYKYIRRYGERSTPVLPNCDDSPSKDLLLEHGWLDATLPKEALFDLIYDPQEANNLADSPAHQAVAEQMRTRLNRWMLETDDPLLMGPVPAPAGAQINDPGGLSPREPVITIDG